MSVFSYSQTAGSNGTVGGRTVTDAMVPSDVNNAFQGTAAEIAKWRDDIGGALSTAGSSNTYTLTTNATVSAYADGQMLAFVANHANTGAATLNVDSVGAKAIRKKNDAALVTGDILQNGHYIVQYDASANSAAGAWLLISTSLDAGISNVVEDTTPQLGGDLDVNGNSIVSVSNGDIPIVPDGTGSVNLQDKPLKRPKLIDYGETVNAIGSIGGGTQDIDLTLGNVVSGTVDTATTTFTFSNPPASGTEGGFKLYLTNGGSQTVNWPAAVDWAGGTAPTLTTSGVDVLVFATIDGGTIWYGFASGLDMQ